MQNEMSFPPDSWQEIISEPFDGSLEKQTLGWISRYGK